MSVQTPILSVAGGGCNSVTLRLTRVRGVPLAGEALGFGDLLGGHLGFENRQQALDGTSCEVKHGRTQTTLWVNCRRKS